MAISIKRYAPIAGTPAEALWQEGHASYRAGPEHGPIGAPPPHAIAWVASLDDVPAAVAVFECMPTTRRVRNLLLYCQPAARGQGVASALRQASDAQLVAAGYTHTDSIVVDGPGAAAMRAMNEGDGGAVVGWLYRRPLGG